MGPIRDYWAALGYQTGTMGLPTGPITKNAQGDISWQQYQNGYIIGSAATGYWESMGPIRDYWAALGYQTGTMGLPTGPVELDQTSGVYSQTYQHGTVFYSTDKGAWSE